MTYERIFDDIMEGVEAMRDRQLAEDAPKAASTVPTDSEVYGPYMKNLMQDIAHLETKTGVKEELKSRLDLVPPEALIEVGHVLAYWAVEHGDYGWKTGTRMGDDDVAAALRIIMEYQAGEYSDHESGRHLLALAICRLLFRVEQEL